MANSVANSVAGLSDEQFPKTSSEKIFRMIRREKSEPTSEIEGCAKGGGLEEV